MFFHPFLFPFNLLNKKIFIKKKTIIPLIGSKNNPIYNGSQSIEENRIIEIEKNNNLSEFKTNHQNEENQDLSSSPPPPRLLKKQKINDDNEEGNNNDDDIHIIEDNNKIDEIYDRFRKEIQVNHVPLIKKKETPTPQINKVETNESRIQRLNQNYEEKLRRMCKFNFKPLFF